MILRDADFVHMDVDEQECVLIVWENVKESIKGVAQAIRNVFDEMECKLREYMSGLEGDLAIDRFEPRVSWLHTKRLHEKLSRQLFKVQDHKSTQWEKPWKAWKAQRR